jgi:asparagine synthase (glutamine-hydrolysing)
MCGINGVLRLDRAAPPPDADEITRTRDAMAARGPDGAALWMSPTGDVGFGHRRLAIIEPSDAGRQPMTDATGRYWIDFNGEIYNYRELRAELASQGVAFRTHTDTEVILALFARDGIAGFGQLRGMYAIALWDERERVLVLARDPNGIKPLYYAVGQRYLRFASQARALLRTTDVSDAVDPGGLVGFLCWGSVPEPLTLWKAIRAGPAGTAMSFGPGGSSSSRLLPLPAVAPKPLLEAIEDSVRAHLVADVPVGLFLSAGIDSALVATLASRRVDVPPVSITLRFAEYARTAHDEGPLAASVAASLGLRHVERHVTEREFADEWPRILDAMDQPSVDGVNTYFVCKAAREAGVKCALSGAGGDELLGGYASFRQVPRLAAIAGSLGHVPGLERVWRRGPGMLLAKRIPKARGLLRYGGTLSGAYFLRRALFLPEDLPAVLGAELAAEGLAAYDPLADVARPATAGAGWTRVGEMETRHYLRNQLLRDADWASMAHSVELRVPLVDAWLQAAARAAGHEPARSQGKQAVLRAAGGPIPEATLHRRKTGFSLPAAEWLEPRSHAHPAGGRSRTLATRIARHFGGALVAEV